MLIWGDQITTHEKDVTMNRVISVQGALCKSTSGNYFHEEQNLVPFELNIQRHTEVSFYQVFNPNDVEVVQEVHDVTFGEAQDFVNQHISELNKNKKINNIKISIYRENLDFSGISGYMKLRFRTVVSAGQGSRTGLCTITDGHSKLPIIISVWTNQNQETTAAYLDGTYLTIEGKVHADGEFEIFEIEIEV